MALGTGTSNRVKVDNFEEHFHGGHNIGKIFIANSAGVIVDVLDLATTNALVVAIVDSDGNQITAFGGGTQYTEDAAAAANPIGTAPILVRSDSPSALVTTDGDNVAQRGTNFGAGFVQVVDSAGAFVDVFGGGTQYTEDAAAAANPVGTAPILVRSDTPSALVTTDGDNVAQRGTNFGAGYVTLLTGAGAEVAIAGGTQYTEDAAAAANPVGNASILVRADTPAALVTTDGDNVAQRGTNYGAGYVQVVDSSGNFVNTFGGGVQYTNADEDATPTGTAVVFNSSDEVMSVVSSGNPLPVRLIDTPTVDVNITGSTLLTVDVDGDVSIISPFEAGDVAGDAAPGFNIMAVRRDTPGPGTGVIDGDYGMASMDATGAIYVTGGGGGTQYTEDAAAPANPVGNATMLVRQDAPGALVTTDGDNVAQRGTNFGAGYVQVVDSAGAFVDTFGGGTQYTEDAAAAANPVGTAVIMVRDDVLSAQTTTDGDNIAARGTDKGELYVKHVDAIDLGATDNAVLDAIAASVAAADIDLTNIYSDTSNIDSATAAINGKLVTGTVIGDVNLGATDNAVLDAIAASVASVATAVQIIDNMISGTEAQVDVLTMPTVAVTGTFWQATQPVSGTVDLGATDNAVLDAIAASVAAVDTDTTTMIGHLDGVETVLGTIDADTGSIMTAVQLLDDTVFAEDVPAQAADKGVAILAVRRDADTTLVGADNDYANLQVNATGALKVAYPSTLAVTQSGTWDEVGINDSGNSITVDNAALSVVGTGTEATAQRVTIATDSTGVLSVDDNSGSITVDAPVATPVFVRLSDGSAAISTLPVSLASVPSHAVTNAGTFVAQIDGAALTSLQLADDTVFAEDAAFTASTSKVSMSGAIRDDTLATLTPVEGDATPLRVSSTGALHVTGGTIMPSTPIAYRSSLTAADVMAAPGTVTCTIQAGGSLVDGDYYFKVVAVNAFGRTTATAGNVAVTSAAGNDTARAAFSAVTGATHYDIYLSVDTDPKWVGRVTEANRSAGRVITVAGTTTANCTTAAGGTAGAIDVQVPGTVSRQAATTAAVNTGYILPAEYIVTTGSQYCDIDLTMSNTGDGAATAVVIVPFFYNSRLAAYSGGDPVSISFGGASGIYQALAQRYRIECRGAPRLIVAIAAISGVVASVNMDSSLS